MGDRTTFDTILLDGITGDYSTTGSGHSIPGQLSSRGAPASNEKLSQGPGKGRYNLWTFVRKKILVRLRTCIVKEVTLTTFEQCCR